MNLCQAARFYQEPEPHRLDLPLKFALLPAAEESRAVSVRADVQQVALLSPVSVEQSMKRVGDPRLRQRE